MKYRNVLVSSWLLLLAGLILIGLFIVDKLSVDFGIIGGMLCTFAAASRKRGRSED